MDGSHCGTRSDCVSHNFDHGTTSTQKLIKIAHSPSAGHRKVRLGRQSSSCTVILDLGPRVFTMQSAFRHAAVEKTSVINFEQFLQTTISTLGVAFAYAFARPLDQCKMILCIDDNPDVLKCEKARKLWIHTVLIAPAGGEDLELTSMYPVDLVIVDYFKSEMNGQGVAIELRRLMPHAPIILLSGAVDVQEQALKWVNTFLAKDRLATQLLPAIAQLQAG
jgi:CheY-like chemotaxis protein